MPTLSASKSSPSSPPADSAAPAGTPAPSARRKNARAVHDEALDVAKGITAPQLLATKLIHLSDIADASSGPVVQGKVEILVRSMANGVQQQPVMLYRELGGGGVGVGKFRVVFGFHRLAAAAILGWETIFAIVLDHVPAPAELQRLRAVENFHRRDVGALEQIKTVKDMLEVHGGDVNRVASELACKVSWVEDRKFFQRLCRSVQEMVERDEVLLGHAREIAKLGDPKDQEDVAEDVKIIPNKQYQRVYTNEEVGRMVSDRMRSLKIVPWNLELPVFNKPACIGCDHNSTSNTTLFGIEGGGAGFCANQACFEHKAKAAEKARDSAIQKLAKQKAEPTAENVRAVAPESLKFESLQRAAKKELGEPKAAASGGAGKSSEKKAAPKTDKERRQDSLLKWGVKFDAWRKDFERSILNLCAKDSHVYLIQRFVTGDDVSPLISADYDVPTSYEINYGSYKDKTAPMAPPVTSPKLAQVIDHFNERTYEAVSTIAAFTLETYKRTNGAWGGGFGCLTEDATLRIAKVFGLKLDPAPVFEDFLPNDLKPAAKASAGTTAAKEKSKGKGKPATKAKASAGDEGDDSEEEGGGKPAAPKAGTKFKVGDLVRVKESAPGDDRDVSDYVGKTGKVEVVFPYRSQKIQDYGVDIDDDELCFFEDELELAEVGEGTEDTKGAGPGVLSDKDQCLSYVLHSIEGAKGRWEQRRKAGLDDKDLRTAIGVEFGNAGGSSGPDRMSESHRGGANPAIWINKSIAKGKPTLEGKPLVDAVRALLKIPTPVEKESGTKIPEKPDCQSLTWYQWANLVRNVKPHGAPLIYFNAGMKPSAARKLLDDPSIIGSVPLRGDQVCRVCGCTEADCQGCVKKTGAPCVWVELDLCSACVGTPGQSIEAKCAECGIINPTQLQRIEGHRICRGCIEERQASQ